jgi:hypothetical protein
LPKKLSPDGLSDMVVAKLVFKNGVSFSLLQETGIAKLSFVLLRMGGIVQME